MPEARSRATRACRRLSRSWKRSRLSVICAPIFMTGLSDVIGSWKTMAISLPADPRSAFGASVEQVRALEDDLAADDPAGRRLDQAQDRQHADRLAAAALADDREAFAPIDGIGDAVDGVHDAVDGKELGLKVPDLEKHRGRSPAAIFRPSPRQGQIRAPGAALREWRGRVRVAPPAPARYARKGRQDEQR